jgi:hypothetical protein
MSDILKQLAEIVGENRVDVFLTTPNGFLDGRMPLGLLRSDPERLLSLAQAFAHPADPF